MNQTDGGLRIIYRFSRSFLSHRERWAPRAGTRLSWMLLLQASESLEASQEHADEASG